MRPSAAAVEIAARALDRLHAVDRARADLPALVAAGVELTDGQVEQIRAVLTEQPGVVTSSSTYRLACDLVGGEPMRRQLAAITAAPTEEQAAGDPDPGPHTGAMVAAVPDQMALQLLAVPDGLSPADLHVTLAFLGPADDVGDLARVETRAVVAELAALQPITAVAGHVAHLGDADSGVVAVAYDLTVPRLHGIRQQLVERLTTEGIGWSDRYAFRPHLTVTYLPVDDARARWPEGPVADPVVFDLDTMLVRFGESEQHTTRMIGTGDRTPRFLTDAEARAAAPGSSTTAAAAPRGYPALGQALEALTAVLADIDVQTAAAVQASVEMGWRSALDRVGRMATRNADAATRARCRELPPGIVAVSADLTGLNIRDLTGPAVDDVATHVAGVAARAQTATLAAIGDALSVDLSDVFPDPATTREWLTESLADAIEATLTSGVQPERIDPSDGDHDPLLAPYRITRDVLAVAGGADTVGSDVARDDAGRPLRRGTPGGDSIPLGPGAVVAVAESILAWADPAAVAAGAPRPVTAAARRRPGGIDISERLRGELADAAARMAGDGELRPLTMGVTQTWRLNWNGQAVENLDRHRKMAGTTIVDESDLFDMTDAQADPGEWPYVAVSRPGDHSHCHCGWETQLLLRER